jgi:hypothetical protein
MHFLSAKILFYLKTRFRVFLNLKIKIKNDIIFM